MPHIKQKRKRKMKIIVNGAAGYMGKAVLHAIDKKGYTVAAAVDKYNESAEYRSVEEYTGEADAIIDFSHHSSAPELCAYAKKRALPLVIATTGHTEEELEIIRETARSIPLFFSANMSLGIALLIGLAKKAASVFPEADIEIVETHHNRKLDAPSGTAKMIFNGIREVLPDRYPHNGRNGMEKREKQEIGMHALRMGNVVGIHEVHICTENQCITLKHEAMNRALFADGALDAAEFLLGKPAAIYEMKDLI